MHRQREAIEAYFGRHKPSSQKKERPSRRPLLLVTSVTIASLLGVTVVINLA